MSRARRVATRALPLALLGVVVWITARQMRGQWTGFRDVAGALRPNVPLLLASCAAVLVLYAVQIHAWR